MRNLHTKFKWVATDLNGRRFAFTEKPNPTSFGWEFSGAIQELGRALARCENWRDTLTSIDHFADVPDRFNFIGINITGIKFATTHKPDNLKAINECITVGNLNEHCADWQESLIEREEIKPISLQQECKTLRKQLSDSEQMRVALKIRNENLEKELRENEKTRFLAEQHQLLRKELDKLNDIVQKIHEVLK